jgi:hypothetical protein
VEPIPKAKVGYGPHVDEHVDTMFVSRVTVPVPGVENEPVAVMVAPEGSAIVSNGDPETTGPPLEYVITVGAMAGDAPQMNFTITTPAASAAVNMAHEFALSGPDRKPTPLTVTVVIVTGLRKPAELGTPADDVHPPDVGDAPANLYFTPVMAIPGSVSFGPNLPVPVILQLTDPVALGGGAAPLTPSPTAVHIVIVSIAAAVIPSILRFMVLPQSARPPTFGNARWPSRHDSV